MIRLLGLAALASAAAAQAPSFEVASVKMSEPITPALVQSGRLHIGVSIDEINVRITQFSLFDLARLAYQVKAHQISGPDWMITERYDIQAKLPAGAKRAQVPAMMQTLLAERFGMRVHKENRDFNIFAVVVAGGGPHLKPSAASDDPSAAPAGQIRGGTSVGRDGAISSTGSSGDSKVTPSAGGNLHIENKRMTLASFVDFISRYCDRPVFDMTGIAGTYEMEFDVSGQEVREAARSHGVVLPPATAGEGTEGAQDPSGVSLASSLRRMGLKLESRKAPAEVIVIDAVEKVPSAN